jgi:hypothetical protein
VVTPTLPGVATIVLLPSPGWLQRAELATSLPHLIDLDLEDGPNLAARTCAQLQRRLPLNGALLVVAHGQSAELVPAVGLALRTSRRGAAGYVLIEPATPPRTESDWPDAPVTVITEHDAKPYELRGWQVLGLSEPAACAAWLRAWPDGSG